MYKKQKPENQGRQVKYNHETRCVTVDGIIVDGFKPAFFEELQKSQLSFMCLSVNGVTSKWENDIILSYL